MQLLSIIGQLLFERIELVVLVGSWILFGVAWLRRRRSWHEKSFANQVNFSLNEVAEGQLRFRTLVERRANDVWLNDYGVDRIVAAARSTTAHQPFLRLRDLEDMAFVKRAVLNVLSGQFAEGFVARALGCPVRSDVFLFAITCERYGDMRTRKLRVLLMRESEMDTYFGVQGNDTTAQAVSTKSTYYEHRLITLRRMAQMRHAADPVERATIGRVELAVVDRDAIRSTTAAEAEA